MSIMCLPYHAHIEYDMYQEDRKLDIPGPFSQLPWAEVRFFLHPQRVEDFTSWSGCYIWEMTSTGLTMMRHYHRLSFSKEISPKCNEFRSKLLLFCRNICKQHINRIQIGCGVKGPKAVLQRNRRCSAAMCGSGIFPESIWTSAQPNWREGLCIEKKGKLVV